MTDSHQRTPELPRLLSMPLRRLPRRPALFVLQRAMNMIFEAPLRSGDIAFLDGRTLAICITDADLGFKMTLRSGRFLVTPNDDAADVRVAGKACAFLQLATRSEDSDTLFFRRELSTTGDTELGLYLKNFLDGVEMERLRFNGLIDVLLRHSLRAAYAGDSFYRRS